MKIKAKAKEPWWSTFIECEVYIVGTSGQKLEVMEIGGLFDGMVSTVYPDEVYPVNKDLRTLTLFSLLRTKVELWI